ncbi:hypothetical protein DFR50_106151 [Roseiarcus fermentans]|uniref:HAF family extracellular repeat protein n=1 Tax=Roseiarcus fermentans TaxID=1473586 RepID=A0A366FR36_9HYPH|nr:hypothetical protein [Roseiarcus fermentans]RBP16189.1 hypothetical protein DFR50_106151 [Roseiarcus fermentans]
MRPTVLFPLASLVGLIAATPSTSTEAGSRFAPLKLPGAASGFNDLDQIVGTYDDANGVSHGYLYWHGRTVALDAPHAMSTSLAGVNDLGQIVGTYVTAA